MLKYLISLLATMLVLEADNISIDYNQSKITVNEKAYKSDIILNGLSVHTEYEITKDEFILSNHYYARDKNSEYFIFDKHTLNLKKMLTISCDNYFQICAGNMDIIAKPLNISETANENFYDKIDSCNIEFISTYPDDEISLKEADTLNYRKVTYKINNKLQTFLYDTLDRPHRMYLTKRHTLYLPLCKTKSHQISILECKIIDGDYRTYSNINCQEIKNEKHSK